MTNQDSYVHLGADRDKAFKADILRDFKVDASNQYILNPVSGEGKLTWQKVPNNSKPNTDLHLIFDEFAFNLDDEQYSSFIAIVGSFSRYIKSYPYRKFRPPRAVTPKMDPKAWINFAFTCILDDIKRKKRCWSWEYMKERRDLRMEYIAYYMQFKAGTLDFEGITELKELERLLSFDDIRLYRHLATDRLKKSHSKTLDVNTSPSAVNASSSWMGWILGSPSHETVITPLSTVPGALPSPSNESPGTEEAIFSTSDLLQLYDAIEFDPNKSQADIQNTNPSVSGWIPFFNVLNITKIKI